MISKIETMKHTDEDLIKIIKETILGDREIKIYMGLKQWEMFNNAFEQEVQRQQLLYQTIMTHATIKLNEEYNKTTGTT